MPTKKELFDKLTQTLEVFTKEVNKHDEEALATDQWTVREVLAHVTFWHTNYAENYEAMVQRKSPPLIESPTYFANLSGVDSLRDKSKKELVVQLIKAHQSLRKSILDNGIRKMTYTKKGKTYTSKEFLHIVEHHIAGHTKQIKRAKALDLS